MTNKRVALVLSSGNARGFAHIGAIDALEERGYHITSVAGTSIGALVGGIYATGQMADFKQWLYALDRQKVVSLLDVSLSINHLMKGDRVLKAIRDVVADRNIEQLPIPFRAVATDLARSEEVVFDHGSLYRAIRASISVPSLMKPVIRGKRVLVDGGLSNALPLNRVPRTDGDLLVAVDVSAPHDFTARQRPKAPAKSHKSLLPEALAARMPSFHVKEMMEANYATLISETISTMIAQNIGLMKQLVPPDMILSIPRNRLGSFSYDNAEAIARTGHEEMMRVIDAYEQSIGK